MLIFFVVPYVVLQASPTPYFTTPKRALKAIRAQYGEADGIARGRGALLKPVGRTYFSWGLFFQDLCEPAGGRPKKKKHFSVASLPADGQKKGFYLNEQDRGIAPMPSEPLRTDVIFLSKPPGHVCFALPLSLH